MGVASRLCSCAVMLSVGCSFGGSAVAGDDGACVGVSGELVFVGVVCGEQACSIS